MTTLLRSLVYSPNLPSDRWAMLRPFAYRLLELHYCAPHAPARTEEALALALLHLSTYLDWAVDAGIELVDTSLLRTDLIDAYTVLRATEVKPHVAERERKVLRAIAGISPERESRARTTTTPASAPYDADDLARIRAWSSHQPSESRLRNASVAAMLCLGAGLTNSELLAARVGDIAVADGSAVVSVRGSRARSVHVSTPWVSAVITPHRPADTGTYVFAPGYHRRKRDVYRMALDRTVGDFVPSPSRMRNTWIVERMNAGEPYANIMADAGLRSDATLSRLWRYTDAGRQARAAKGVAA